MNRDSIYVLKNLIMDPTCYKITNKHEKLRIHVGSM